MTSLEAMRDVDAEREVIQTLWEEARTFGGPHGRKLMERVSLSEADFTDLGARLAYGLFRSSVLEGFAPGVAKTSPHYRQILATLETDEVRSVHALDAKARELRDLAARRAVTLYAQELLHKAREPDLSAEDLVHIAETNLKNIQLGGGAGNTMAEARLRVEQHVRDVQDGKKTPTVKTGFPGLDRVTGGLPPTLIVMAAMPGVGKSAFEGTVLRNMALRGEKSFVFSMEDPSDWLAFRLLAHESGVSQTRMRYEKLTVSELNDFNNGCAITARYDSLIGCDDRAGLGAAEVLATARRKIRDGAKAVFLDNMTAMRFPRDSPRMDLKIQDFLVSARALANETGVPFVVLSHTRRREGVDVDELPRLTDCSETSALEKTARLAYGFCRNKETNEITLGVLKGTNCPPNKAFKLGLRASSALIDAEIRSADEWRNENDDG